MAAMWRVLCVGALLLVALVRAEAYNGIAEYAGDRNSFAVLMRARPTSEDQYCQMRAGVPEWAYGRTVIGFEPLPGAAAHHITLYRCERRGVFTETRADQCDGAGEPPLCGTIAFVWAHGGSPFYYPPGVGFSLGNKPGDVSFALQVHFGQPTGKWMDKSGVRLILAPEQSTPVVFDPLIWLLIPNNFKPLPPKKGLSLVTDGKPRKAYSDIIVYAVRAHAHSRGVYNEVVAKRGGEVVWQYQRSTQLPQSFVPLPKPVLIRAGDEVSITCAYDTTHEHTTIREGATKHDEMCNVYLMYYDYQEEKEKAVIQSSRTNALRKPEKCKGEVAKSIRTDAEVVGVSTHQESGRVFVFHRASTVWDSASFRLNHHYTKGLIPEDVIQEVDSNTGQVIRTAGANQFYLPHAIRADAENPNVVWLIDVGGHVVVEYDMAEKRILRTIGEKDKPGRDNAHLCQPTDMAFSPDNSLIFVSDGYCNSRILVFNKRDLTFVKEIGTEHNMDVPHSIEYVSCSPPGSDVLVVTDREQGRVLLLDPVDGKMIRQIREWDDRSYPYSAVVDPHHKRLYVGLVIRGAGKRQGGIWASSRGICELDSTAKLEGEVACTPDKSLIKEPHMLAILNKKLYVAQSGSGARQGDLAIVSI